MLQPDRICEDDGLRPVSNLGTEGLEVLNSSGPSYSYCRQPIDHSSPSHFQYPHGHGPSHSNSRRICGLRQTTFWLLCIIVVLVIGGAVGGVVGGRLASKNTSSAYVNLFSTIRRTVTTSTSSSSTYLPSFLPKLARQC